jgi:hypothetical protein
MLAIMVLWAALPGFACLAPTPHHDCCQQMMQDCGSSMAMADPSCCKVHSSDTGIPPAQASQSEGTSAPVHVFLGMALAFTPLDRAASGHMAEIPPDAGSSGHNSILRI